MKISFIGDVSFTGNFGKNVKNPVLREAILSPDVSKIFKESDYTVCNLEGPLTERDCVLSTNINVKSPIESLSYLLENKINVFGLANNHMFDAEYAGYKDTVNALNANSASYLGAGDTLREASDTIVLESEDVSVSLIAVGHNVGAVASDSQFGIFSYVEEDVLKRRIKEAQSSADWVVLFYHTGPEYNFYPTPVVRNRLKRTLDFGVDIIVAHHPHVMQGMEYVDDNKLIVYSLGNFIFDLVSMRSKKDFDIGLISTISFSKKTFTIDNVPVRIDPAQANVSLAHGSYNSRFEELSDFSNYNRKMLKDSFRVTLSNPLLPSKFGLKYIIFIIFMPLIFLMKFYLSKGAAREFLDYILDYFNLPFLKTFFGKDEGYKYL